MAVVADYVENILNVFWLCWVWVTYLGSTEEVGEYKTADTKTYLERKHEESSLHM